MNRRRLVAEMVGTALLLVAIVGSGIATSVDGAVSAQLFQHAVVVGAALAALIFTFGPVSGAHLNPSVTIVDALFRGLGRRLAAGYITMQLVGAILGVAAANWIFGHPVVAVATQERTGVERVASEALAIFGLLVVIFGTGPIRRSTSRAGGGRRLRHCCHLLHLLDLVRQPCCDPGSSAHRYLDRHRSIRGPILPRRSGRRDPSRRGSDRIPLPPHCRPSRTGRRPTSSHI